MLVHINQTKEPQKVRPCSSEWGECPVGPQFHSRKEANEYLKITSNPASQQSTEDSARESRIDPRSGGISGAGRFVDVKADFSMVRMREGDLEDPRNRYILANGLCGDLANAIIQQDPSRKPVFATYDITNSGELDKRLEENPGDTSTIAHVLVSTNHTGMYLDAYGLHNEDDLKQFYGDDITVVESDKALKEMRTLDDSDASLESFAKQCVLLEEEKKSYSYNDMPESRFTGPNATKISGTPSIMHEDHEHMGISIPEDVIESRIKAWRDYVGADNADKMMKDKTKRDKSGGYHLTVVGPPEVEEVGEDRVKKAFSDNPVEFTLGGIGVASRKKGRRSKETWFITASSPNADKIRESLGLPKKTYHVTIGFTNWDIYDVDKGSSTVVIE